MGSYGLQGDGARYVFAFQISPGHATIKSADFIIELDAFKGREEAAGQNAYFYLNGLRVGTSFITTRGIQILGFDPKILCALEKCTYY